MTPNDKGPRRRNLREATKHERNGRHRDRRLLDAIRQTASRSARETALLGWPRDLSPDSRWWDNPK